ncbi:MAG: hypothetical protein FRX49_09340 [Trebouxia sp. A1-2]|nr:MAG: hypothetical protein FRX49_09340 [Trebouxia sp. A1-2]
MSINILPYNAVHQHSMSAAAGISQKPTLCHQLKNSPRGVGDWGFAVRDSHTFHIGVRIGESSVSTASLTSYAPEACTQRATKATTAKAAMGLLLDSQPWKPVATSFASSSVVVLALDAGFGFRPASWNVSSARALLRADSVSLTTAAASISSRTPVSAERIATEASSSALSAAASLADALSPSIYGTELKQTFDAVSTVAVDMFLIDALQSGVTA